MIADAGRHKEGSGGEAAAPPRKLGAATDRRVPPRLLREAPEPAPRRKRPGLY